MHPILVAERDNSEALVAPAEPRKPLKQAMEEAVLESVLFLRLNGATERRLYVRIKQVRELSVIANQDDAPPRQGHRDEEV